MNDSERSRLEGHIQQLMVLSEELGELAKRFELMRKEVNDFYLELNSKYENS